MSPFSSWEKSTSVILYFIIHTELTVFNYKTKLKTQMPGFQNFLLGKNYYQLYTFQSKFQYTKHKKLLTDAHISLEDTRKDFS